MTYQPDPVRVIDNVETLRLVFDPFRLQVISMLADNSMTVKQMAEKLDTTPHRLYYHIRMLEEAGILTIVETHLVNGIVEKVYGPSAIEFIVDRGLLNFDTDEGMQGFDVMLRETLDSTREDITRSGRAGVIDPRQQAPHPDALLLRRGLLFLTKEQAEKVATGLQELLADALALERRPEAKPYIMQMAFYPTKVWSIEGKDTDEDE